MHVSESGESGERWWLRCRWWHHQAKVGAPGSDTWTRPDGPIVAQLAMEFLPTGPVNLGTAPTGDILLTIARSTSERHGIT